MQVKVLLVMLYVVIILRLGFYSRKKIRTVDDFAVGNRFIGSWMSAFSFGTNYFPAVLIIGFAGKVGWGSGLSILWIAAGNAFLGTFLAWKILAPKNRELSSRLGVVTMPSFLETRYDSTNIKIFSNLKLVVMSHFPT